MAYQGLEVNIPLGLFGIISDLPPSDIPLGAVIDARNVSMINGYIEKAPGTLVWNPDHQLPAGIVSIYDYWPETHLQRLIAVTEDGQVFRDIGDRTFSNATAIKAGLGPLTPNVSIVEGGQETAGREKKLFLFTEGNNQVQVLEGDGVSLLDIAAPASDWTNPNYPTYGVIHRNRLWAFQGQFSYASDTGDHENFQSNFLFNPIFPGEGGAIKGAFVFKGRLFAFKDEGFVYYLDDQDTNSSNWVWRKLASNFGLSGPNAIIDALNDMIAGNTTGTLTSYVATDKLGDVESADIFRSSSMENWARKNLDRTGIRFQHGMYYPEKKLAFFTYRTYARPENDALLVIDLNGQQPKLYLWPKGTPQCLAMRRDLYEIPRPIYGDSEGFVHMLDYADRIEGDTAYTSSFQTPFLDFRQVDPSLAGKQKHFDYLKLEFIEAGNWDVFIDYYIDGKFIETKTLSMDIDSEYLGTFALDEDLLRGEHSKASQVPLRGTGRNISFVVRNSGARQTFKITGMQVGFRPSGQQASSF